MNKYGRTGVALLGLVALGGLVSLPGGPNVFSTFSSSISTLFPESDAPVVETKAENKQDEIPVAIEPEVKETEKELPRLTEETIPDNPPLVVTPEPVELPPQSQWVNPQPAPETEAEKPKGPIISKSPEAPPQGPNEAPKTQPKPFFNRPFQGYAWRRTSPEEFKRKYHTPKSGSTGTGKWCSTIREAKVRELKKVEQCI